MSRQLTDQVKEKARQLGFSLVGVTRADPPPHLDIYRNWVAAGRHGEMNYLSTPRAMERRADPRTTLPECKSILVLAIPYSNPVSAPQKNNAGRIAAYAWGDDYHEVLKARLQAIVSYIEEQVGQTVPNRWYTDSGPLLERELAQRAGLGWVGKNSMLINPERGSYFLLAEILLGIELEPDPSFATDQCGACTRCLAACPTACILPNRTLDAERCISYLTIELKGSIPNEFRTQMGDWIFGCDICQTACPWNERFAAEQGDSAFAPKSRIGSIDLETELTISTKDFNRKFKNSPVKRAKRRGYLRNVAVALGNSKQAENVPVLRATMQNESEALVRGHAAWALGQIGCDAAKVALKEARRNEKDDTVLKEIERALSEIEP